MQSNASFHLAAARHCSVACAGDLRRLPGLAINKRNEFRAKVSTSNCHNTYLRSVISKARVRLSDYARVEFAAYSDVATYGFPATEKFREGFS